jgi:hypothetical protein
MTAVVRRKKEQFIILSAKMSGTVKEKRIKKGTVLFAAKWRRREVYKRRKVAKRRKMMKRGRRGSLMTEMSGTVKRRG